MQIIRTFVPNSFENYNHLAFCPHTRKAAAVDPFDARHIEDLAQAHHLTITQIWITHEHGDHIRELSKLKALTNAEVYAPNTCKDRFDADHWLGDEDSITLGHCDARHLLTPGHTPGHGVFVYHDAAGHNDDFAICGDTLFNGGVGNVRSGNVDELYETVAKLQMALPEKCFIYNGHDYITTNLKFVKHHFPACSAANEWLSKVESQDNDSRSIQSLATERSYNPFLNLTADWLTAHPEFTELSPKERFVKLRGMRDQW